MKDVKVTNFTEYQANEKLDLVVERDDCDVTPNYFLYFTNLDYKNKIDSILETLTLKEQVILHLRFGLIDGKKHSLLEVARMFGITRERVRQIDAKALFYLRRPSFLKRLLQLDALAKTNGHESLFKDLGALGMNLSGDREITLDEIEADNKDRFKRAVEAYKKYAFVRSKEDLLKENLFENAINRVSRDFAIGTDMLRELLEVEASKIDDADDVSKEVITKNKKPDSK